MVKISFDFQQWMNEWADFGFSKKNKILERPDVEEKPIQPVNLEYVCDQITRHKLGLKEAKEQYFGEIQWGQGDNSVKLVFGPYRGLRAVIRKQTTDLKGESAWICKKVLEIRNYYDEHADSLTQNLLGLLEIVDKQPVESPIRDFKKLENLVLYIADHLKTDTTQRIFLYEGVRRLINNEHYIIHFGVTGMGVQSQDQKRVDQMQVEVKYENGLIKIACQELGDKIQKHRWILNPSQFLEYYSPAQTKEEIAGTIISLFNSY